MKTKTLRVTSQFPASADAIWEKLQRLDTLQYIAFPYATFQPTGDTKMVWREGQTSTFQLKLFGFVPMGIHTIHMIQFDKQSLVIYSNENNKSVPLWNHRITLKRITDTETHYTDEVELYAGWKTHFVYTWGLLFYRHRQRKWKKLLCSGTNTVLS